MENQIDIHFNDNPEEYNEFIRMILDIFKKYRNLNYKYYD